MSSSRVVFSLHFRPVGQGLFSHGHLQCLGNEGPSRSTRARRFHWVYDCGSERPGAHLIPQISAYQAHHSGPIDLLILSHFDKDHVIGIQHLLKRCKPRILVAPYLTLDQRLAALARLNPTDVEYARFLIAPGTELRRLAGRGTRLVFIAPGGERPPEEPDRDATNPNFPWPPEGWDLKERFYSAVGENGTPIDPDAGTAKDPLLSVVNGSTPLTLWGVWEFCFFNRPEPDLEPILHTCLEPELIKFYETKKSAKDYHRLIENVRAIFEMIRGPGGHRFDANEISVVTYSGPIRRDISRCFIDAVPRLNSIAINPNATVLSPRKWPAFPMTCRRCGILFSGDITLDDATYRDIEQHFGAPRLRFVSHFQVPHHGSKKSFKLTSASHFCPDFSFFSSARHHAGYDHPSAEVIEALQPNGPTFINEFQGASIGGIVHA